jgi:tRNA nucleotidyltransferase (CCA-adding enzyme)
VTNEDIYVRQVLSRHENAANILLAQWVINTLRPHITAWGSGYLEAISVSGSTAKGTAITGTTDVDVLVSISNLAPGGLKHMYDSLFDRFTIAGYVPRKQNVSIGMAWGGTKIDIVPAKKQNALSTDHSLWSHKHNTWRQTNIDKHIRLVSQSGRLNEIKLLKIWRKLHGLELPSFLAEMLVIEALRGYSLNAPAANFARVLEYVSSRLTTVTINDPANTNNIVTNDITLQEKRILAAKAQDSLRKRWMDTIW